MNWWVWQFAFSRIQLPFLGEILIDISKNPSEQIQFSHSKSLKRSWGWQHFGLYFCVVLAKNRQASSINCQVFLLQLIIKERQDCWSWLVSVEKSKLWKRWNVFVQCRDDQEMFLIIWKMMRTTLWAWFNMLSSQTRADYFDVTLVGDDSKYNLAHEVVLATSSAKRVHPHPLVNFRDFRLNVGIPKVSSLLYLCSLHQNTFKLWVLALLRWHYPVHKFWHCNISVSKLFHVFSWYRYRFRKKLVSKKYRYRFRKFLVSKKSFGIGFEKIWYRKKYRYWYRKNFGIEKSIGIGIEKNWYRKKVSVSVSFRFWVSSHTVG